MSRAPVEDAHLPAVATDDLEGRGRASDPLDDTHVNLIAGELARDAVAQPGSAKDPA
jgi:hypothetical protein